MARLLIRIWSKTLSKDRPEETSMEIVTVFSIRQQALNAVRECKREIFRVAKRAITPDSKSDKAFRPLVTDTEDWCGMGRQWEPRSVRNAGGATLGLAAATFLVPGVGPVLAFGLLGATLLGATGAAIGSVFGEKLEEGLGEGIPHEDIYLYEDALRHGVPIVVFHAHDDSQADAAHEVLKRAGALGLDEVRESWWAELRDQEWTHYQSTGMEFHRDELSYRKGFEAAQHPERRGRSYSQSESSLRQSYNNTELDIPFRRLRARPALRSRLMEKRKIERLSLNAAVLVGILESVLITSWFARTMYTLPGVRHSNARRVRRRSAGEL